MFYVRINIGDINTKTEYLQKNKYYSLQMYRLTEYLYTYILKLNL